MFTLIYHLSSLLIVDGRSYESNLTDSAKSTLQLIPRMSMLETLTEPSAPSTTLGHKTLNISSSQRSLYSDHQVTPPPLPINYSNQSPVVHHKVVLQQQSS